MDSQKERGVRDRRLGESVQIDYYLHKTTKKERMPCARGGGDGGGGEKVIRKGGVISADINFLSYSTTDTGALFHANSSHIHLHRTKLTAHKANQHYNNILSPLSIHPSAHSSPRYPTTTRSN